MTEKLLNGYLKIQPLEHKSFVASTNDSYQEVGVVLARDEDLCSNIPIGSTVFFDSFMAKKYPDPNDEGKFQWYIHFGEIVKYENAS